MIKNRLYTYLHKHIADYLFGFDESQLEVAILSGIPHGWPVGSVNLSNVNVKPEKLNSIFEFSTLPFQIKAGMIGTLKLQVVEYA